MPLPEHAPAASPRYEKTVMSWQPRVEEVAAPVTDAAAATEPEVIKEKKPEAGAEAAGGDKGKDAKPAKK